MLAVTGSNGKTSVKTLLLSILRQLRSAYANPGNRNNEIGLPLAARRARRRPFRGVHEMGPASATSPTLTAIARPDVALVNNTAPAHLERMGNLLGVAQTKGGFTVRCPMQGAVINADDAFVRITSANARAGRRAIRFFDDAADVARPRHPGVGSGRASSGDRLHGEVEAALPAARGHNVRNC